MSKLHSNQIHEVGFCHMIIVVYSTDSIKICFVVFANLCCVFRNLTVVVFMINAYCVIGIWDCFS